MSSRKTVTTAKLILTDTDLFNANVFLKELVHKQYVQRIKAEDNFFYLDGIKYEYQTAYYAVEDLNEVFDESGNCIESEMLKVIELGPTDDFNAFLGMKPVNTIEVTLRFALLDLILGVLDYLWNNLDKELSNYEENDWTPPNNFKNGTDAEQEIWKQFNSKKPS